MSKVKRICTVVFVLLIIMIFSGCAKKDTVSDLTDKSVTEVTPEATPEPTVEVTPELTPEPTVEVTPELTPEPTVEVTPELTPEPMVEDTPYETPESEQFRTMIYVYTADVITEGDNCFIYNVYVSENEDEVEIILDENTEFGDDSAMYLAGYESGDTAVDWCRRGIESLEDGCLDILGVFDISITGNHIDCIYGSYWWD